MGLVTSKSQITNNYKKCKKILIPFDNVNPEKNKFSKNNRINFSWQRTDNFNCYFNCHFTYQLSNCHFSVIKTTILCSSKRHHTEKTLFCLQ